MKKLNCIALVDDDDITNIVGKRVIAKADAAEVVKVFTDGQQILDYLSSTDAPDYIEPALILLDINMPQMDGLTFAEHFEKLDPKPQSSIVFALAQPLSQNFSERASKFENYNFIFKPLTESKLEKVMTGMV